MDENNVPYKTRTIEYKGKEVLNDFDIKKLNISHGVCIECVNKI